MISILRILTLSTTLAVSLHAKEITKGHTALYYFNTSDSVTLKYDGKNVPLLKHPVKDKRIAFVPVNYRTKVGEKRVVITRNGIAHNLGLRVLKGNYPSETLRVAKSKVHPNPEQQKRIGDEYKEAITIYNTFTKTRYWNEPFAKPMTSKITSNYGTARLYNGSLRSFHSGTDFKAAVGTPIHAVNDGVVVLAKDRYYAGNSVLIDHGEGLYSCYYHLSEMNVKPGDHIGKGDKIGLSGQSGRVTGPHLHFAIMLQGVQVEPMQFLETVNGLFPDEQQKKFMASME